MAAVSVKAWDGNPARWPTAKAYCASCLVAPANPTSKDECSLPVREPNGAINKNALGAAAGALAGARGGVDLTPDQRKQAARNLVRAYQQARMIPPASLRQLAGDTSGGMNDRIRQAAR